MMTPERHTQESALAAAEIVRDAMKRPITVKFDGHHYTLCIGYTDRDDERATLALDRAAINWGLNSGLEIAADTNGGNVRTIAVI